MAQLEARGLIARLCRDDDRRIKPVRLTADGQALIEQAMAEKANSRGHSSSQQTAALAKEAGVGTLIATHFSSRYDAEGCLRMLAECREIFPNTLLAEDFMVYKMA